MQTFGKTRRAMFKASCLAAASGMMCLASPALAQEADAPEEANSATQGNTIIVTARKREESLQDTPLSIQAFSEEEIARSDIADLADLAAFAPGVSLFENTDRGYGQVFIRGMQNTPPVGDTSRELASVFIDGVYFVGGVSGINTDNIERVEVIKGPQSALYGRSTFSGAINFITRTPSDEFSGKFRAKVAEDQNYEFGASMDIPLVPGIASARLSGQYRTFGGQYRNQLNNERLGEEEDWSLTGQLFLTPAPGLSAKLTASYLEQDDGPAASVLTGKSPTHNFTSPSGATFFDGVLEWDGIVEQNSFPSSPADVFAFPPIPVVPFTDFGRLGRLKNGLSREFLFTSWNVEYEGDAGYSVTYLGSYSKDDAARLFDFEYSAEPNYFGSRQTDSEAHSHELRIASPGDDRFTWLVGGFYMEQDLFERDPGGIFGSGTFAAAFGITGDQVLVGPGPRTIVDLEIVNKAVFGSVGFDVTDALSVSFEGRYQEDELTDPNVPTQSTKAFLPRAIVEYQASPDVLLYAVAAKGLRPTVINTQFIQRTPAEQDALRAEYPELDIGTTAPKEEIWSYEVGAKTTLMDGRMIFNINGYYADWKDQQVLQSLLFDFGQGVASTLVTVNGSDVEAYGIELQTALELSDQFNLSGNFSWNKTKLVGPGSDAIIARFFLDDTPNGERLPQTPEFSGSVIADYRQDGVFGDAGLFLRAEGVYVGSRFADTLNLAETGASFDVNLRAGLDFGNFAVTAFVENLFNDMTFESLRSNADCATTAACSLRAYEAVLPRKRQIGLIAELSF
ncbi:TonB-dependent receptor [Altererythrobacter sp. GH1-8]|uniref:TonB-dependent receptor n=1 Tax=Altererythrobacter sp. GH1-8 TaxID=3349333 RepID=UPI00374D3F40